MRRCKEMEFGGVERIVEDLEGDADGWVTHDPDNIDNIDQSVGEMTLDKEVDDPKSDVDDSDEEALDMENFEESGMLENVDPSEIIQPNLKKSSDNADTEDSVVHTRTYDLHIVYNKYYQTPHLFLIG
jgi:ubiquitin-like-conjugating enzyme ATG3